MLYGGLLTGLPKGEPSIRNCTPVPPVKGVFAVRVTDPNKFAPLEGEVKLMPGGVEFGTTV
jgi:hypothetical protein